MTKCEVYMATGVFFHEIFRGKEWLIIGDKFWNFPGVMKHALKLPQVELFTPEKVPEELLLKIQTRKFVENLKNSWYCEGALYAVGGCVEATERILGGDIGLTQEFFPRLAGEIKEFAGEICQGRYLVLTHGGKRADVAEFIFPKIVEILAS